MPANLENSAVATGLEKVSFHSSPQKRQCSNYHTIALISHASKVMLKILQAKLQQYMNCELPDVKLVLEKAEEPEIKLQTSTGSLKKTREFQRIARRDKKDFLSDQCKEIEENNRMGKTIEIYSRKLEILREHFMQRWAQYRTEMVWT